MLAALAALAWQPAVGSASQKVIESSGPLTSIYIDEDLACQVKAEGDTSPSFYGGTGGTEPGGCGTFLALTAGEDVTLPSSHHLFGPTTASPGSAPEADFRLASQTLGGSGTESEPFVVTTKVGAYEPLEPEGEVRVAELTETDSYVTGQDSYRTTIAVTNVSKEQLVGALYHAGDCFLSNLDTGYGAENVPSAGSVACTLDANNSPPARYMAFTPIATSGPGAQIMEGGFSTVWSNVNKEGTPFPDTVEATTNQDNGMGLSWFINLKGEGPNKEPGGTTTVTFKTTVSPPVGTIQATEGSPFSAQVAVKPSCGIFTSVTPVIEWGDGLKSVGTFEKEGEGEATGIRGTHEYVEEGTYNGTVTYENECGKQTVGFLANVADAPLTAAGVPVSATAGLQFSATVATFTDADPIVGVGDYRATIDWGDGTTSAGALGVAAGGGFTVAGSHTYAAPGAYQISAMASDVGGATATATSIATVVNPPVAPPSLLGASPPTVLSTTSAAFTTTVNPHGLATSVHFEYGPVLGAKAAAITYGSVTPDQPVGSDFANHTVTATVTGLLPNVTYNVRAVATNSAGSALGANQTLVTPADPPPPPPVLGKSVNVAPVSGIVYVELPPGAKHASLSPFDLVARAFAALTKGQAFIPLTEARQIPVGSVLDTTGGVVGITTATTASRKGKLQSGDFGAGLFKLLQGRRQKGLTELNIIDAHSARQVCATLGKAHKARTAARRPSSKVLGRLNANAHGRFTARGQYSAATVRGTIWNVANQCDGTLTRVTRGVVSVRDFRRRRTLTLFTGQSYLAKAPHF